METWSRTSRRDRSCPPKKRQGAGVSDYPEGQEALGCLDAAADQGALEGRVEGESVERDVRDGDPEHLHAGVTTT